MTSTGDPDTHSGDQQSEPTPRMGQLTTNLDDFSPQRVAERVEEFGLAKSRSHPLQSFVLGTLAGGFVGLGGLYFTVVTLGGSTWHYLAGGIVFAIGYIIAILAGTEVFTSNNLLMMALASRKVTLVQVLGNWGVVLCANAIGASALSLVFLASGMPESEGGDIGRHAIQIAADKAALAPLNAFALGVLGNLFVCLAVWVALAGRTVTDKIVGTLLPLSAIGALELEHAVSTLYFIPRGLLVQAFFPALAQGSPEIPLLGAATTFLAVTAGNIIGGSLVVALSYQLVYVRPSRRA
ncbi:formate/nitrite transporter family protein [Lipingzhangella sp. LS1_29]|uniref:Formate/nitrite transporter family protein n=1 Tax=Lipingzhangella rawalii TaxID=2055835 RepID=A0ABU2HAQ7_9ACTN|nr:formate/nitrite transporter family protein [Lipingzhangella rawalii]MDS1272414.1 formate/nitrite transporter family protein [Lipingzhangella rawalii]